MPAISKIRLCNVSYENGGKRYNDQLFHFDGQNSAILLENGGGKTVFIQTVLQCIIPHMSMAERKIKDTLFLEQGPAHIAIEWIINEQPRRYGLTCVTLYSENNQLNSLKYTYEYSGSDDHGIEELPFKVEMEPGNFRPATKGEIGEYYQRMARNNPFANGFTTIVDYNKHLENQFKIIPSEWKKVAVINSGEGNVDEFFNRCKTTEQLLNNLLIPVIEEAIEGENTSEFAMTFEKQREHFKKNRILHDKIEQTQGVKEHIDSYVELYKKMDTTHLKVRKVKERAISILHYLEQSVQQMEKEVADLAILKETVVFDEGLLHDQKISYQIRLTESNMLEKDKLLDSDNKRLKDMDKRRNELGARRQNIQISKAKTVIKDIEDDLNRLKEELSLEELSLPTEDIYIKLDEIRKNIKGYFSYELESIRNEVLRRKDTLESLLQQQTQLNEEVALVRIKETTAKENILKKEVHCEVLDRTLNSYYDELFDAEIGCVTENYMEEWKARQQKVVLNQHYLELQKNEKELELRLFMEESEEKQHQLDVLKQTAEKQSTRLIELQSKSNKHIEALTAYGLVINNKELIYTKEESYRSLIAEKLEFFSHRRHELVQQEQSLLSKNIFKDLVHPSVLDFYHVLKDDVDFIALGQDYLEQLIRSTKTPREELMQLYPFFAMTYVTNRQNKEHIMTYLDQHGNEMYTPIIVLTMEEVNQLIKSDMLSNESDTPSSMSNHIISKNSILPYRWSNPGEVSEENSRLLESLQGIQVEQEDNQEKWIKLHDLQYDLNQFFEEYSYQTYRNLIDGQLEIEKNSTQLKNELLDREQQKNDMLQPVSEINSAIELNKREQIHLAKQIELGSVYMTTQNTYRKERLLEETYREEYSNFVYQRKELEYRLTLLESEKQTLVTVLQEYAYEERKILDLPLYKEVAALDAICANVDILVLVEEKESLERRLLGMSSSRDVLIAKIKDQEKLRDHYTEQLNRLSKEAEFAIETITIYYEHEEDDLFDQFVVLKKEIKTLEKEIAIVEKERFAFETERNLLLNELKKQNKALFDFDCDLKFISTKIAVFEGTLRDTKRKIDKEEKEYRERRKTLDDLITHMKIKDGTYGFSSIEPVELTKTEKVQMEQHRDNYISILFRELHEGHGILQQAKDKVIEKRHEVLDYCKEVVEDFRLKEAITNGLMEKKELNDLIAYQERMSEIIYKTIQLANDDKRESDHELQTFLSHLLTYTKTVVNEFHILQKKTLIEFDGMQRQIFVFDIPELNEESAKEGLRLYVDQMITLFEEEKGKDEESIRQLIEDRLSIKNLLPVVLLQQPIKVKCRKVTNDLQINKAPMSWEYSNKWSGGEKWSKNMTLFLGILNYLAEKKQHLSASHKKNRTVILDNPFGKASSKHVLDPVFFIAERLGFQIIALTAHAEGQFISDYFPVVYSLRLRETDQVNKLLMTSERVLNYTYLKEKAPASVARLQDAQQLQLF